MVKLTLNSDIGQISGVGNVKKKQLNKLGIYTVSDLIYYFPRAYEKRGDIKHLSNFSSEIAQSFILTVSSEVSSVEIRRGLTISKFRAFDESGSCEIVFFNSPFVKNIFHTGSVFRFYGKATLKKKTLQLTNPKYEAYIEDVELPYMVPVYQQTVGINSGFLSKIISACLECVLGEITDPLSEEIRIKNSFPVLSFALKNIHFPENEDYFRKAVRRLAFDEMLCFGLSISTVTSQKNTTCAVRFSPCDISPVLKLLPYELTSGQKQAVNDIYMDTVLKNKGSTLPPMTRIIVGDVGCGKTICSIIAAYIASKSSYQTAIVAPTEILATQHFAEFSNYFDKLNIKVALLLGSTPKKAKKEIYSKIEDGSISVLVGTHALFSDNLNFNNLGLIVTDEQHRFGVFQRGVLKEKTKSAHMLVMSATPIPRTLALTIYGDMDISKITELPKGRQQISTYVVDESYRKRLNTFMLNQVKAGGQIYVVCPKIEEDAEEDELFIQSISSQDLVSASTKNLKNVKDYMEILRQTFPQLRIQSLHGKLTPNEKADIMNDFSAGEIDILVSTTVIEVGVNVPNACVMIVENADRFGLAQLHQLRGRVGRGTRKSYCILVSDSKSQTALSRLEIMKSTSNGFEIAEKDLLLRGPGDFFSMASNSDNIRQSGGFDFKFAKLCDDLDLFTNAFATAKMIISEDPDLSLEKNRGLKQLLSSYVLATQSTIS